MKNFYFLLSAALVSLSASAQVDFGHRNLLKVQEHEKVNNVQTFVSVFKSEMPSLKTKAPSADFYIYPTHGPGVFFLGMGTEASAQGNNAVVPAGITSYFLPYISEPYVPMEAEWTWKTKNTITGEETVINDTEDPTRGALNIWMKTGYPTISATLDGTTVNYDLNEIKGNKSAGTGIQNVLPIFGKCDVMFAEGKYSVPVSHYDYGGGLYAGFSDTTFLYSNKQENAIGDTPIGAFDLYETGDAGALIHEVDILVSMLEASPAYIIPDGSSLKMEVKKYEKDEEGKIILGESLGFVESSTVIGEPQPGYAVMMSFKFQEEVDGNFYPQPIEVPANTKFALVLSGWTPEFNMQLIQGRAVNEGGYLLYEDGSYWAVNGTEKGEDFAFQMIMEVPTASADYPLMHAFAEGGFFMAEEPMAPEGWLNYNFLNTSVRMFDEEYAENYTIEVPDWVIYEHQDINEVGEDAESGFLEVTQEEGGVVYDWDYIHAYALFLQAQPLPDGVDVREGLVTLTNKLGDVFSFKVMQGKKFTGVESVKVANASVAVAGDNLMLTYGEDYSKATVYNVAGSVVASYDLPQGGSFEVPAAELNGVYLVVFEGASREVVKVVK